MRFYRVNGNDYPSVTTVLQIIHKPGLAKWREHLGTKEANQIAREAADIGKEIHKHCEVVNGLFKKGNLSQVRSYPVSLISMPQIKSYTSWLLDNVEEVVGFEKTIISKKFGYAGTTDLLCRFYGDTALTVGDIKTSNNVWPDMGLQLAAYAQALKEDGYDVERGVIIHINKENGNIKVHEFALKPCFSAFLSALYLFRHFGWDKKKPESIVTIT